MQLRLPVISKFAFVAATATNFLDALTTLMLLTAARGGFDDLGFYEGVKVTYNLIEAVGVEGAMTIKIVLGLIVCAALLIFAERSERPFLVLGFSGLILFIAITGAQVINNLGLIIRYGVI